MTLLLLLNGYGVGTPYMPIVRSWTLYTRGRGMTIDARDFALSLYSRDRAWALDDRDIAWSVASRNRALTLEDDDR